MHMRRYMETLHKLVEQQNAEREQVKQQEAETLHVAESSRVKDLDQQIIELMHSLPPAQANRPWTMEDLLMRLQGRYRARPHGQHVAASLRRLGWQRRRIYGAQWGGRRYWHPTLERTE